MDQEQQGSNIFIVYHCPCLDGIYSLMSFMMTIQTKLKLDNWNYEQLFKYLDKSIEDQANKQPDLQQNIIPQEYYEEQDKSFFYSQVHPNIKYVPMQISNNENETYDFLTQKFPVEIFSDSILILLDYYGRTYQVLSQLSKLFKKVVIVDHHKTVEGELSQFKNYDPNFKFLQKIDANVYALVDLEKAGCDLSIRFAEVIFQKPVQNLVTQDVYQHLIQFLPHVSDNDLYLNKLPDTDAIISAILDVRYNMNAYFNPVVFHEFISFNYGFCLMRGKNLLAQINQKLEEALSQRQTIKMGKFKGYAVQTDDRSIMNKLGNQLSQLSVKDGMDNFGVVYHQKGTDKNNIQLHLRSCKEISSAPVSGEVAVLFGGGGHSSASSLYLNAQKLHAMLHSS